MNTPYASDSALYDIITTLLARPLPPLVPGGPWRPEMAAAIDTASAAENASVFVTATLHLLNDDLDRAHVLVQARKGDQTADYLHMLVHRREGDWSNTGYWVRRAGEHPVYATLLATIRGWSDILAVTDVTSSWKRWDPNAMLELCRQASGGKPDAETAAAVAWLSRQEIAGALDWCVRDTA